MAESQKKKPHAVMVPHPAQGHVIPMLKVAKLLYQRGFYITFVVTKYNQQRLLRARGPNALDGFPDFRFAAIDEGVTVGDGNSNQDPIIHCDALMRDTPLPFFKQLVDDIRSSPDIPPVTCIICDGAMTYAFKVAEELDIPCAFFWTPSACGFLSYCYFRKIKEMGLTPLKDESYLTNGYLDTVVDVIPGLKGIRLRDFPHFVRTTNPEDVMFKLAIREIDKTYKCSAVILNTIDALEHGVLDTLSTMFPSIYAIGPLQLLEKPQQQIYENKELASIGVNLWEEDLECLSWLDQKEPNSVIYVNFGSLVRMTSQELLEFGWGLANSKQNFLWAIRPDLVVGESVAFPPEFGVEIKDRGLLVNWTPQERILGHPSVGGFLTHCGWNSVLESIVEGVPMICWPAWAEQFTNCWFICSYWGLGMEINDVKREEVERLVRELMVGENGKRMKAKAMEWKKVAEDAVTAPTGSSYSMVVNQVGVGPVFTRSEMGYPYYQYPYTDMGRGNYWIWSRLKLVLLFSARKRRFLRLHNQYTTTTTTTGSSSCFW